MDIDNDMNKESNWHLLCRLCAKNSSNVSVILKNEAEEINAAMEDDGGDAHREDNINSNRSLAAAIETFFHVNINNDEALPKTLCTECYTLMTTLVNYAERVKKVQCMFNALQQEMDKITNADLHAFRAKYGLLDLCSEYVLAEPLYTDVAQHNESKIDDSFENGEANPLELPQIKIKVKTENTSCKGKVKDNIVENDNDEEFSNDMEYEVNFKLDKNTAESTEDSNSEDCVALKRRKIPKLKIKTKKIRKKRKCVEAKDNEDGDVDAEADDNSFICTECPRTYKRMQGYRLHMKNVHDKEPKITFTCAQCPRAFKTQFRLKKHEKTHLPLELRKVIPCPFCDKKFTSNDLVKTHIKQIHMKERPFICEECGIALRTKSQLQLHILYLHTSDKPFKCEICEKGFKEKSSLKRHMEIHDTVKRTCSECGIQLSSSTTLKQHMLVHSDEMQHKCDYCGRAFKRSKSLKVHLILHTGLKPYSCDFCDLTFATGSNCRKHEKTAHPEEFAALVARGGDIKKTFKRNIPKLAALKTITKTTNNLEAVASKQSGFFAFNRKVGSTIQR